MIAHLADYLAQSAARWPDCVALVDPAGWSVMYRELDRESSALATHLAAHGVIHGDRVGVVLPKSATGVVAFFGIMKAGAAYVPVDASAPAERGRRILADCQILVRRSPTSTTVSTCRTLGRASPRSSCRARGLSSSLTPHHRLAARAAWMTSPTSSTRPARPACPRA